MKPQSYANGPKPAFKMPAISTKRDKNPNCSACRNASTQLTARGWALVCSIGIACHAEAKDCPSFKDARRTSYEGLQGMA